MKLYGEMHRFRPAIASEFGARTEEHVVNHRARKHGRSNYGISRTIRVLLDLMTVKFLISYSTRPLQIFGLLGEMLARTYHESQNKPTYVIRDILESPAGHEHPREREVINY